MSFGIRKRKKSLPARCDTEQQREPGDDANHPTSLVPEPGLDGLNKCTAFDVVAVLLALNRDASAEVARRLLRLHIQMAEQGRN